MLGLWLGTGWTGWAGLGSPRDGFLGLGFRVSGLSCWLHGLSGLHGLLRERIKKKSPTFFPLLIYATPWVPSGHHLLFSFWFTSLHTGFLHHHRFTRSFVANQRGLPPPSHPRKEKAKAKVKEKKKSSTGFSSAITTTITTIQGFLRSATFRDHSTNRTASFLSPFA